MARYKYFNSGLYEDAFYTKHKIDFNNDDNAHEDIEYNSALLAEYYQDDCDFDNTDENNSENDECLEQVDELFWDALSYWAVYFEPLIFDEAIALECGLIPFAYRGINMLALAGCGMDLSPKLDAYQALVHNTIDKNSRLFSTSGRVSEYFEYVVGKKITERVLQVISE